MKSQIIHLSKRKSEIGLEDRSDLNADVVLMDTIDFELDVPDSKEEQYVRYIRELEKDREEGFAAKDEYIRQLEKDREEGFAAKDKYIRQLEKDKEEGFAAKDQYIQQLEKDKEDGFAEKDAYIRQLEKDKAEGFKAKDSYIYELERDREKGFAEKDIYIKQLEHEVIQTENKYLAIIEKKNEYIDRIEALYNKEKQNNRQLLIDTKSIMSEKQGKIDELTCELNRIKNSKNWKIIQHFID